MSTILALRFLLSSINLLLLLILIYSFARSYKNARSIFTAGFLLFTVGLFLRTLFAAPFMKILILGAPTVAAVDKFRLIADVFELIALSAFLYLKNQ